ncbi:uncharacterized protein [Macrobrachium rosenbergii]|uniref:uncharacterized protein isoform X2 n=1 Tax=Macrobrachium rosenbergii TaxID=79674 RepID=UPI0034D5C687
MESSCTPLLTWLLFALTTLPSTAVAREDPVLPDIWKIVEDSYDSDVAVTIPDLNPGVAFLVDELYDIKHEEGTLRILDHGKPAKMNYYAKSGQFFSVVNGTECAVGNLVDHPGYKLWGWDYEGSSNNDDFDNYIYGPSALLRLARDFSKYIEFHGEDIIRDINADHWHFEHPDGYHVDYYFAVDEWNMPYGHTLPGVKLRAPLQVRVLGKEIDPWHPDKEKEEHEVIYDYTDFQPFVAPADWKQFLVEEGMSCEGRASLDPDQLKPPVAPDTFKVFLEILVNRTEISDGVLMAAWMYHDSYRNAMRLDVRTYHETNSPKSSRTIQDIGTGIKYRIDEETGDCTISTWSRDDFVKLLGSEIADVIMPVSQRLFYLDDAYVFSGYSESRGLLTSRWTATRSDISIPGKPDQKYNKVVVDYEFLTKTTDEIGEHTTGNIPVRIHITIYDDDNPSHIKERQIVELLRMQTTFEAFELNPFDVRECMTIPTQRSWFKMSFRGEWHDGAYQNQDEFKRQIMEKIYNDTHTSYVRMPEVQLDHDEESVYAILLLLEPAPYRLQFQKMEDMKPSTYDTQLSQRIEDIDVCAGHCLAYQRFNCKSFYECPGQSKKSCFVSNSVSPKPPYADVPECKHFKKATSASDFQQPNTDVGLWLEGLIRDGKFNIKLTYEDFDGTEKNNTFRGYKLEKEIFGDDPVFVDYLRKDFHISRVNAKLRPGVVERNIDGVSYADCLFSCDLSKSFDCQTFSYCYDSRKCSLSTHVVSVPADDQDVVELFNCVVISRKYVDDYNAIDGTVYTSDARLSIHKVSDSDKCAYLCDNATDFTCRSFDYCSDVKVCDLYTERSIDIPDEKLNHSLPFCTHFERDALVDFQKHPNQMLDGRRDRFIKDISTSYCAEVCEQEPDYSCNGFDYCKDDSGITCFLTEDHYSDDGVVIHDSQTCDHYSREYYDGKDRDNFAHVKNSDYKYGPGDMAGLGVSMLVISVGLTLGGVYVYNNER